MDLAAQYWRIFCSSRIASCVVTALTLPFPVFSFYCTTGSGPGARGPPFRRAHFPPRPPPQRIRRTPPAAIPQAAGPSGSMLLVRQRRASASPSAFPPHRDARAQSTSELLPGVDPAGDPAGQEHPHQGHQWHQGKDPQDSKLGQLIQPGQVYPSKRPSLAPPSSTTIGAKMMTYIQGRARSGPS